MEQHEVDRMLGKVEEDAVSTPKVKISFTQGEMVKITDGAFESFEGTIEEIDDHSGKISVLIEVFGRSTPVELDHWQVESL
jgi:transcriptional antiterminator NusG